MSARPLSSLDRRAIDVTQGSGTQSPYRDALTPDQKALLRRRLDGISVLLAGQSNVVMQLANYPVGRGVLESTVRSGSVMEHPFKRFRTTVGYIDIAIYGDDQLRADYRSAVNGVHRQVRSKPSSPVNYNAFNRNLQLWVASCMYYGFRDTFVLMHGEMTPAEEEDLLRICARFGTTLQMPLESWHPSRAAFEAYWAEGVEQVHFDDDTRRYLRSLVDSDFFPLGLKWLFAPTLRFFNTGYLPPQFRDELGLTWSDRQDRIFRRTMRAIGILNRPLPESFRRAPANLMTLNIRTRRALGRPLV